MAPMTGGGERGGNPGKLGGSKGAQGDGALSRNAATCARRVVVLRFNDVEGVRKLLSLHGHMLAAVLLDPMPSRAGLIAPKPEFIAAVQQTARNNGILVIADEALNLRQSFRGASACYDLVPDLVTMDKIIGGGLPIGVVGGREDVMKVFDASTGRPPLPQGGTFSANPLSMIAGLSPMRHLDRAAFIHLETMGKIVRDGIDGRSQIGTRRCALPVPPHSFESMRCHRPRMIIVTRIPC